jgi:mono/diheme cytochrome c family protein
VSHSRARRTAVALAAAWAVAVCARTAAWQQPPTTPPPTSAPQAGAATPAADERSTLSGVYTDKQADAGADIFSNICANCHKPAEHSSATFKSKWNGALVWDLYVTIGATMPKDDPESLTDQERAQIVALILRKNGLPAGSTDLSTDPAALKKIRIEMPKDKTMTDSKARIGYWVIGY